MSSARIPVAIIGSGNIGTDLMIKILRNSDMLEVAAMVGIDPTSDGLARAERLGVPTTAEASTDCSRCPISRKSASPLTPLRQVRTRCMTPDCATMVCASST
jgi:acetaldehyde dehydrogenase (acetylating)